MRQSNLFGRTLRDTPSEAEVLSHQLLLRAGFIRQLMGGSYSMLPLGLRVGKKIEAIIREEMDAIGGQELLLPVVQPGELWRESGRFELYGDDLARLTDRNERDLVIAPTHEEAITDTARRELRSYRQVPLLLYQLQVKFRDEPRPRAGLLRVREFTMKDAYSFDRDEAGLEQTFRQVEAAYRRIYQRCGLDAIAVEASSGMIGGSDTLEFQVLSAAGEDTLILCESCGYTANREIARFAKDASDASATPAFSEVLTPECKTIEQLANFLNLETKQTAKAVFFHAPERGLIFAVVRGDHEVNEEKLAALAGVSSLRVATSEEIEAVGAVPGYASPIGVQGAYVIADEAVVNAAGLVAGANKAGYHLLNVLYGRDWQADQVGDITLARAGDACERCGHALSEKRAIEVGHIFKLGTRYSAAMNATYQDDQGKEQVLQMGCYGIGVGRLLATVVETHHDERGLVWPEALAPFQAHLVCLGSGDELVAAADQLYAELRAAGIDVLYDDRDDAAGVKFNDADLLGIPWRVVVSARNLKAGQVEVKRRDSEEKQFIALESLVNHLRGEN
jgi:prolyl-tRNA synthetase